MSIDTVLVVITILAWIGVGRYLWLKRKRGPLEPDFRVNNRVDNRWNRR